MDTVPFVSQESNRIVFQSNNVVPLVKVKATGFSDVLPTLIVAGSNRVFCFTNKKPNELRILNRIEAQKTDTTVSFDVTHLVAIGELTFAVAGEQTVAVLSAELHADGSLSAVVKEFPQAQAVRGLAAGSNGTIVVSTVSGTVVTLNADGSKATSGSFQLPSNPKAPLRSSVLCVHKELAIAVVPGKSQTSLDVVSLNSEKSLLSKPWLPHGDTPADEAYIFQAPNRVFSSAPSGSRFIITTANGNTELRFWILSEDNTVSLVQQVSVTTQNGDAAEAVASARLFAVNQTEEYILLSSTVAPSVVAIELDRNAFKASRITDWNATAPVLFCAPATRKVSEGKSVSIDLAAVIRTFDTIALVTMDASRLVGASNLTSAASAPQTAPVPAAAAATAAAATRQASNVAKWFGNSAAEAAASPVVLAAPLPTSVSSSIAGNKVTSSSADAQYVASQAVSALKSQGAAYRETLTQVDGQIVAVQRQASQVMKLLQDPKAKDDAQLAGREFAMRNKHRLLQAAGVQGSAAAAAQPQVAAGGYVVMTQNQAELMQGVRTLMDSIPGSVRTATTESCKKLLGGVLPQAISRAMTAADAVEQEAALPKLSVTEGMQNFSASIDKIHQSQNNILKQERSTCEALCVRMMTGTDRIAKTVQGNKNFLSQLKSELSGLRGDVAETKQALKEMKSSSANSVAVAPRESTEEILAAAVALGAAGRWADAISKVDALGDVASLMHLLQSDAAHEHASAITASTTIPMPLMVQVCRKLSSDLRDQLGNVPFRVKWLHDFIVDWDDHLQELKEANAPELVAVKPIFEEVLDNLKQVDPRKEVDRSTKNNLTLCRRLISALVE